MKILIGYDGSDCAKSAIQDLKHAGLPSEANVMVVSAAETLMPINLEYTDSEVPAMNFVVERASEITQYAKETAASHETEAVAAIQADFPDWKIETNTRLASPSGAILEAAAEWNPDLIIVGSHGRGAMGRLFMGSVSMKVLSEAHGSVRVSRSTGTSSTRPMHIVLGFDGSADSQHAVETLLEREYPADTIIHIVAALDLTLLSSLGYVNFAADQVMVNAESDEKNWLDEKISASAEKLRTRYATVLTNIDVGSPKDVLLEEADECNAECIMLGAKGHGRIERMLLGSVSHAIAARAKCSVEVVRAPHV